MVKHETACPRKLRGAITLSCCINKKCLYSVVMRAEGLKFADSAGWKNGYVHANMIQTWNAYVGRAHGGMIELICLLVLYTQFPRPS